MGFRGPRRSTGHEDSWGWTTSVGLYAAKPNGRQSPSPLAWAFGQGRGRVWACVPIAIEAFAFSLASFVCVLGGQLRGRLLTMCNTTNKVVVVYIYCAML